MGKPFVRAFGRSSVRSVPSSCGDDAVQQYTRRRAQLSRLASSLPGEIGAVACVSAGDYIDVLDEEEWNGDESC